MKEFWFAVSNVGPNVHVAIACNKVASRDIADAFSSALNQTLSNLQGARGITSRIPSFEWIRGGVTTVTWPRSRPEKSRSYIAVGLRLIAVGLGLSQQGVPPRLSAAHCTRLLATSVHASTACSRW